MKVNEGGMRGQAKGYFGTIEEISRKLILDYDV
jgi:hypothetical protein